MTQCPRCDRAVSAADSTCPACGQVLAAADASGSGGAAAASGGQRPAHLSVLDSSPPAVAEGAGPTLPPPPKPRLVSRAGPAMPAPTARADDTAQGGGAAGWLARLEAAKRVPGASTGPGEPAPTPVPSGSTAPALARGSEGSASAAQVDVRPPPLPPPLPSQKPKAEAFAPKPAHLLVAELEAQERVTREAKARRSSALGSVEDEISKSEIAKVEIPKPETEIAERHLPRWVVPVAAALVVVGLVVAYVVAEKKAPVVVAEADPEVRARTERLRKANAAIEEGHALFDAKDPAKIDLAIAAYRRALEIDPKYPRAERALGVAYAAKGDDAEAASHYKRFLELDPKAADAAQVRAIVEKYESKAKKP